MYADGASEGLWPAFATAAAIRALRAAALAAAADAGAGAGAASLLLVGGFGALIRAVIPAAIFLALATTSSLSVRLLGTEDDILYDVEM